MLLIFTIQTKGGYMTFKRLSNSKHKDALLVSLPLIIGYFPVAMAFGLLSKNNSISFRDTSLLSIIVFAGASQFMALDLIAAGVSTGNIIFATFLLNLRHLVMSASLAPDFKKIPRKFLPLVSFAITDESFSVFSFNKDKISLPFVLIVNTLSYSSWVIGTMVGYAVGEILPASLQASMGIGLYAMFAALLSPELGKSKKVFYISILSSLVYIVLFYSKLFSSGWDIIIGIILSSALAVVFFDRRGGKYE